MPVCLLLKSRGRDTRAPGRGRPGNALQGRARHSSWHTLLRLPAAAVAGAVTVAVAAVAAEVSAALATWGTAAVAATKSALLSSCDRVTPATCSLARAGTFSCDWPACAALAAILN